MAELKVIGVAAGNTSSHAVSNAYAYTLFAGHAQKTGEPPKGDSQKKHAAPCMKLRVRKPRKLCTNRLARRKSYAILRPDTGSG